MTATPTPARTRARHGLRWPTVIVVVLGLALTATLTVLARNNYQQTEQRLTLLQTRLTGQLLTASSLQVASSLERVVGLTAESGNAPGTFESAMAPLIRPRGSFVSSTLALVSPGGTRVLAHVGMAPLKNPQGAAATALYRRASRTTSLVTTRTVAHGLQRLGYLVSAHGPGGTYVVGASQQLPTNSRFALPANSPEAELNFALYFGKRATASALLTTNAPSLPLPSGASAVTVPFGTSSITIVAEPRSTLTGFWEQNLTWLILVAGLVLTASAAVIAEWLARRRSVAEAVAGESRQLYQAQREVSETLQAALLPKAIADIRGFDIAARYLPATRGVEVGGDWYSVVPATPDRFVAVVGDVSGHGISAASAMANVRYTIRALAKLGLPPVEILEQANDAISVVADHHFATVLVASIDHTAGTVTLANAGHPPPLLVTSATGDYVEVPPGTPLGLDDQTFTSSVFPFEPGSTLVAFTDGLVETRHTGVQAGMSRLASIVRATTGTSSEILAAILSELPGSDHEDDVALLVIRRLDDSPRDAGSNGASASTS